MVLMGQGCPEQGHDPISGELVDGAFILMNLIHQDPQAAVHDLVDFFGVQLLGEGSEAGHIGKQHSHQLSLTLQGTAGVQDFIG